MNLRADNWTTSAACSKQENDVPILLSFFPAQPKMLLLSSLLAKRTWSQLLIFGTANAKSLVKTLANIFVFMGVLFVVLSGKTL